MWHFCRGYVTIQIEGFSAARFLKRLTEAGIRVSRVRRIDAGTIALTMPAKRFRAVHRLKKGLPLRVRIVGRSGLPFQLQKLRRRPVLWIGTVVLFCAMVFCSFRIWVIRIDETERVDPEEIRLLLKEHGIRPGALLQGPILITAANDLSAQIHDAAFIGLDREGVMLKVTVVEALPASPKKTACVPSDVIAQKDGVVTDILVMRGQARVKVGDSVKAGDVLISGTVNYREQSYETAADGTVRAAVQYRAEVDLCDRISEAVETERTEAVRILRIGETELFRTKPSFPQYRLTDAKTAQIGSLFPIFMETMTAREIVIRERMVTEEEAEQEALIRARENAYALTPRDAAIINTYGTIRTKKGTRRAVVIVTAEETIGRTEEEPHDG